MVDSKRKEITGRVDYSFYEELRECIHRRRSSQQDAVLEGLRMWMGVEPGEDKPSAKEQEMLEAFLGFLRSAPKEDIHLVQSLIARFTKQAQERAPAKGGPISKVG
jgi:hypothetical protein